MKTNRKLYWDELRQCGVSSPRRAPDDGYQRPDPRYCYDYGPAKPEVVATPAIKAAMSRMEEKFADGSAKAFAGRMAKAMGLKAMAPHEARHEAVDLREADFIDPF